MPNIDFCAQVRFSSSIFPLLSVLVYISSLFLGKVWLVKWGTMEGQVVLHFDFFSAGGGPGFYFFGFLLEERGGKRGDFIFVGMGSCWWCGEVHIVGKERGRLG